MTASTDSPGLTDSSHRRTLVIAGERDWARGYAMDSASADALWLGTSAPPGVRTLAPAQAHQVLGEELSVLVIDCFDGLDPDALGATTGALRGGGVLLLLTPPLAVWEGYADPDKSRYASHPLTAEAVGGRFLKRLATLLQRLPGVQIVQQGESVTRPLPGAAAYASVRDATDPDCLTADQAEAVAAVIKVATGHRRRPLVLTADRGRGKSAALGVAAARLLSQGLTRIVVTAPRATAVSALFERAAILEPQAERHGYRLILPDAELRFMAPDELLRQAPQADLVLVDEAAAIPVPLLSQLLDRHARIVFASTVHGYEGNGRGFALRFRAELDARTPQWRALSMRAPIRYPADDPLEFWVNQALLLDAEPAQLEVGPVPDDVEMRVASADQLAADEPLLREAFGLLVQAHYQTRPADLRQILDAPNLTLWLARAADRVLAVCVVLAEGGLEPALAEQVAAGARRPQGHLIPQSLAAHTGQAALAEQRTLRVMRIAVHPALRRRGLGRRLLHRISSAAAEQGMDWFGASFAADEEAVRFWQSTGCELVRIGAGRDGTSGTYSATLLMPLSAVAVASCPALRQRCLAGFAHGLADTWQLMEPTAVAALLRGRDVVDQPTPADVADARAFAAGQRDFAACQLGLWRCLVWALAAQWRSVEDQLLIRRVLQRWSDVALVAAAGIQGRAELIRRLRAVVAAMLEEPLF